MTFWVGDKNQKPDQWSFDNTLIETQWDWVNQDLVALYPMWEKGGTSIRSVAGRAIDAPFTGTPTWSMAPYGPCLEFTDNVTEYALVEMTGLGWNLATNNTEDWPLTLVISGFIPTANPGANRGFIQIGQAANDGTPFTLIRMASLTLQFFLDGGLREDSQTLVVGQTYTIGMVWEKGLAVGIGLTHFYLDGKLLSTYDAGANHQTASTSIDLYIGNGFSPSAPCKIGAVMLWHGAKSHAQMAQIGCDPFGPLRMEDDTPWLAVAAAGGLGPAEIITMLNRDKISPLRQM